MCPKPCIRCGTSFNVSFCALSVRVHQIDLVHGFFCLRPPGSVNMSEATGGDSVVPTSSASKDHGCANPSRCVWQVSPPVPFSICSRVIILTSDAGSINTEVLLVFLVQNVVALSVIPCWATYRLEKEANEGLQRWWFAERARTSHETSTIYRKFCP